VQVTRAPGIIPANTNCHRGTAPVKMARWNTSKGWTSEALAVPIELIKSLATVCLPSTEEGEELLAIGGLHPSAILVSEIHWSPAHSSQGDAPDRRILAGQCCSGALFGPHRVAGEQILARFPRNLGLLKGGDLLAILTNVAILALGPLARCLACPDREWAT